ncbi:helix-turn-helix transcriptional regulator [Streptomyces sp. NPDC006798]|uniref:helix-turn-helix transcriptional regulator n=1 Tax=Streptomyces sp. NPDC006798 TaxID=3155462 RepID=UPI0033D26E4D
MTTTRATGPVRTTPSGRRTELRDFLRSRRARVSPQEVGLPGGGLRRTPGLRREEVATLAGIGVSWYTWLEQGREITVSGSVVESVSRVLRLDATERAYFYRLAGLHPPAPAADDGPGPGPELARLLDAWPRNPAYVLDRQWNYLLINEAARILFGVAAGRNCLETFFTDPRYRGSFSEWEKLAPQVVAGFRAATAAAPDDPGLAAIRHGLAARSPEFARMWDTHDVLADFSGTKTVTHPVAGEIVFDHVILHPAGRQDLRVIVHLPRDAEGTAALERLLAAERDATREG